MTFIQRLPDHRNIFGPLLMLALLLSVMASAALPTSAKDDEKYHLYKSRTDVTAYVEQTLATAKANNKKALFVIGANWCHDSRSMAEKLSSKEMQPILNDHYELAYISVGYFDEGLDVSTKFGLHTIYGTPTVMIIDPDTQTLLNKRTVHKWRNADRIDLEEAVAYFKDHADKKAAAPMQLTPAQRKATAQLVEFEKTQGLRLRKAYQHLGPQLKAYKEGNKSDSFDTDWTLVAKFRSQLTSDMRLLGHYIKTHPQANTIAIPAYDSFPWEEK